VGDRGSWKEAFVAEESDVRQFHIFLHPYPTFLVTCGTRDERPNIITIAWLIPVSVDPPLVALSVRPTRHSYGLLARSREFVVNVPSYELADEALRCGRRSGRSEDKFERTGLTPGPARRVAPPIIEECRAFLECRIVDDIEEGDHRLLVAEVIEAYARDGFSGQDGLRDVAFAPPLLHVGRNRFATLRKDAVEPKLPEA